MLTLFSCPKPFRDHIKVIQTNALQSWIRLSAKCEIILFGDEEGTAGIASSFNVRHVPQVSRNEYGTPLLDDVFSKAQVIASHNILAYINADVILMSDIVKAVERVQAEKKAFLMVGRRWNIDLGEPLDFSQSDWQERLRASVLKLGKPTPPEWIDYFVFPRGFYRDLRPFALGRAGFDNWLLWKARSLGGPIIDASEVVMVVHQKHDYSHHPQGKDGVWNGAEAKRNRELMGGWHHCFTLSDATYRLTPAGLKLNLRNERLTRMVLVGGIVRLCHWLKTWARLIRYGSGLCKSSIDRLFETMKKGINFLR
jgi:hypothetical protein